MITDERNHPSLHVRLTSGERNRLATQCALTDEGNAQRVVIYFGDQLRYDKHADHWYKWDRRRWLRATEADMIDVGRRITREIDAEVLLIPDADVTRRAAYRQHATRSATAPRIVSMIKLAAATPGLWRAAGEFDREPYLLNFTNGTVDVRTLELRPHAQEDWLTGLVPHDYVPDAPAPMFTGMVRRTFQVGDNVADYVQRVLGYCLLGRNVQQKIFFIVGEPNCGKSKIVEVVGRLVGPDYAHKAKTDLIARKRSGHHASETFSLIGSRFVTISETSSVFSLDESTTKELTGDSVVTTRELWKPGENNTDITWTIVLVSNEFPAVNDWDDALKRRIVAIPAGPGLRPEEVVPDLDAQIVAEEAEGVLAWLVAGAHRWWREYERTRTLSTEETSGLTMPIDVEQFTLRYADEMDWMGAFIRECTEPDPSGDRHAKAAFLTRCKGWRATGEHPKRNTLYARIAKEPGVKSDGRTFTGIKLRPVQLIDLAHEVGEMT